MTGPVFIRFGERPEEGGQLIRSGASETYPPEVRARLEVDAGKILARYVPGAEPAERLEGAGAEPAERPEGAGAEPAERLDVTVEPAERLDVRARSALLPLLHLVQSEDGYVTPAGIGFCSQQLGLTEAEVWAVATFYSMYRRSPTGDYYVGVCTNTLCAIMGGDAILTALEKYLGIISGGTTQDGKITLEHIECNAACDFAPVVMVNWEFFDNQTPESARALVEDLSSGQQVTPSRGATLCTFRETARILAGFADERPEESEADGGVGTATLAGVRVARELGMVAPSPSSVIDSVRKED